MHVMELCAGFSDKSEGSLRERRMRGVSRYNLITEDTDVHRGIPQRKSGTMERSGDRVAARSPVNLLETPDTGTHVINPRMRIATVMANGARKLPVLSSTNPVSAGPMSPAKLPKAFCKPVHNPD
jgi:hypothetical protein